MALLKKPWFIVIILASVALMFLPQQAKAQDFSISRHRIGGLYLSPETTVSDISTEFGRENVSMANTFPEGSPIPTVFAYLNGKKVIEGFIGAFNDSSKLESGLAVYDDRFVTDRGIRVGSTVGELKKKYAIDEVVTGEASTKHAICREAEMTFELRPRYRMPSGSIGNIPDDVEIISIYVWLDKKRD